MVGHNKQNTITTISVAGDGAVEKQDKNADGSVLQTRYSDGAVTNMSHEASAHYTYASFIDNKLWTLGFHNVMENGVKAPGNEGWVRFDNNGTIFDGVVDLANGARIEPPLEATASDMKDFRNLVSDITTTELANLGLNLPKNGL